MDPGWIPLPPIWSVADVQAVVTLLINLSSVLGIWIISYASWKAAAVEASKKPGTKLLTLLCINSLGDVIEAMPLLRSSLDFRLLGKLIGQAVIVVILTVTAMVAGPIARFAIRPSTTTLPQTVNGFETDGAFISQKNNFVRWNSTIERLKAAGFPNDQLLDYLPDVNTDWKFDPKEWNSSWTASCEDTPLTVMPNVTATGNYTGVDLWDELPALRGLFPPEVLTDEATWYTTTKWMGNSDGELLNNVLVWALAHSNPDIDYFGGTDGTTAFGFLNSHVVNFKIAAILLRNVPSLDHPTDTSNFAAGPVEHAAYTAANCTLQRAAGKQRGQLDNYTEARIASPWVSDAGLEAMMDAFSDFQSPILFEETNTNQPITHPDGPAIFQFYQAYLVSKDTQHHTPAQRLLSVARANAEISAPALAVFAAYVVGLAGALLWARLVWRLPRDSFLPMTKVEWVLQVIREVGGREIDVAYFQAPWQALGAKLRGAVYGRYGAGVGQGGVSYRSFQIEPADLLQEPEPYVSRQSLNFEYKGQGER